MSQNTLLQQLKEQDIECDEQIFNDVVSLVDELNLDTEELVNEWLAYSINNEAPIMNRKSFHSFSKQLRYSKSAKITNKTRPRSNNKNNKSNTGFIHTNSSLRPLMENALTPNTNHFNKNKNKNKNKSYFDNNSNTDLMDKFLSLTTPSKSMHKSIQQNNNNKNKNKNKNDNAKNISNMSIPTPIIPPQTPIIPPQTPIITPQTPIVNIHQTPIPKNNTYKSRKNSGQTIDILNENLNINSNIKSIQMNAILPLNNNNNNNNNNKYKTIQLRDNNSYTINSKQYRFMNENMFNKQNAIRQRISFIGKRLMQQIKHENEKQNKQTTGHGMDIDEKQQENTDENAESEMEYSDIDTISQRECYYLGRILSDGENINSNKITHGNIMLESECQNGAYAKRIKLDISSIHHNISLFPGQIIAIKGINCMGQEINVKQIYTNAFINTRRDRQITTHINDDDGGILQIMVGCGPFTPQNSLEFNGSPLHDFGKQIIKNKTNVVVLMGPFTDMNNDLIKHGNIQITHYKYFLHLLSLFIQFIGADKKVIVIPSTKDIHYFSPFPQWKYEINAQDMHAFKSNNTFFLNNPSEFSINNVNFGICSADFLWDCNKIGLTKGIKASDRLLSIMAHCINQQNFYPLYPASNALRMDYNQNKYLYMNKQLDVFIMPSNLQQFVKIYKNTNTICINPSFLTRVNSGGKYAMINIHKSNDYTIQNYTDLIRVDIKRI